MATGNRKTDVCKHNLQSIKTDSIKCKPVLFHVNRVDKA